MPSIFNTVKLNIMGFLSAFLKYTILSLAFIMLMIDVVQTRPAGGTRFKITIKGLNNVTQGSNQPAVYNDSGYVYISNLGATGNWEFGQETQNEPQWSEIQTINGQGGIDKHNNSPEEVEEGAYNCYEHCICYDKGHCKWAWEGGDDEPGKGTNFDLQKSLRSNGHVAFTAPSNGSTQGNYFAFTGNPERDIKDLIPSKIRRNDSPSGYGHPSNVKWNPTQGQRTGLGMFIIVIPNSGNIIQHVKISNWDNANAAYITYKYPVDEPNCNNSNCLLGFDNDFVSKHCLHSDKKTWESNDNNHGQSDAANFQGWFNHKWGDEVDPLGFSHNKTCKEVSKDNFPFNADAKFELPLSAFKDSNPDVRHTRYCH